jgi:hypothetical protein
MATEPLTCWRPEVRRSEPRRNRLESGARLGRERSVGRGVRGVDPWSALRAQNPMVGRGEGRFCGRALVQLDWMA